MPRGGLVGGRLDVAKRAGNNCLPQRIKRAGADQLVCSCCYGLPPLVALLCYVTQAAAESRPFDGLFVTSTVFYRDTFHMGVQLSENLNGSFGVPAERAIGYCYIAAGSVFVWLDVDAVLRVCAACIVKRAVFDRNIGRIRNGEIVSAVVMQVTVCDGNSVAAGVRSVIEAQINTVSPALGNVHIVDSDISRTGYIDSMSPFAAAAFMFPAISDDLSAGDGNIIAPAEINHLIISFAVGDSQKQCAV